MTTNTLEAAHQRAVLVRITRSFESGHVDGYVEAIGATFFMMLVIGDGIRYGGFQVFRRADVVSLQPSPHAAFVEAALALRGLERPRVDAIDVSTLMGVLASASQAYPLVAIHCEAADPDVCHIGRVVAVDETELTLHEITPDATWEEEPSTHVLHTITRVDFGGPYEEALALVADDE
jgi:hypothetical protein